MFATADGTLCHHKLCGFLRTILTAPTSCLSCNKFIPKIHNSHNSGHGSGSSELSHTSSSTVTRAHSTFTMKLLTPTMRWRNASGSSVEAAHNDGVKRQGAFQRGFEVAHPEGDATGDKYWQRREVQGVASTPMVIAKAVASRLAIVITVLERSREV